MLGVWVCGGGGVSACVVDAVAGAGDAGEGSGIVGVGAGRNFGNILCNLSTSPSLPS